MKNLIKTFLICWLSILGGIYAIAQTPGTFQPLLLSSKIKSVSYLTFVNDINNLTVYTFSSVNFGTVDPNRYIVVNCSGGNSNRTISGITIGGISTTQAVQTTGSSLITSGIFAANVPTGTTGNIVLQFSAGQSRAGCGVWALYNIGSANSVDTANSTNATANLNVNVQVNDILIVGGTANTNTSASPTGYTENFDTVDAESVTYSGGSALIGTAASPRTVTMTWGGGAVARASVSAVYR